jgi:hypothetical protein
MFPESIAAASILTARAQAKPDHFGNKLNDGHPYRGLAARCDHARLKVSRFSNKQLSGVNETNSYVSCIRD